MKARTLRLAMSATQDKIPGGVLAIHKPKGISSAQVIRNMQEQFNPSKFFAPYIRQQQEMRKVESRHQRTRRSQAKRDMQVKIGHGGTLDPMATGVLITGINHGTKVLGSFLACTKTYETVVLFGAATDSYDSEGKVVATKAFEHITRQAVEEALSKFRGKIMQRPPIFSALRVNGKHLYDYAREGKEPPKEIETRPVEVLDIEMTEWMDGGTHGYEWPTTTADAGDRSLYSKVLRFGDDAERRDPNQTPSVSGLKRSLDADDLDDNAGSKKAKRETQTSSKQLEENVAVPLEGLDDGPSDLPTSPHPSPKPPAVRLRMTTTSGFYVRSLCHDLGEAVGSLGLMASLVRTRQGEFELGKNVLEYNDLAKGEAVWAPKVESMLDQWEENHETMLPGRKDPDSEAKPS